MKNLFTIRQIVADTAAALLLLTSHCAHAIDYRHRLRLDQLFTIMVYGWM
jgi:hypothetical protein